MIEKKEPAPGRQEPTLNGEQPANEIKLSEVPDELAGAVDLLEPGKPLVLNGGFLITDGGHLIISQYVDIGVDKLRHRPSVLVKAIEAKYGLEHVSNIQLSAPYRFRDYGETFIRDDQEGHARRETKTGNPPRSYEENNREQERALQLLGQEGVTISNMATSGVHTETESMTFGGSSWIYCTSMPPTLSERDAWCASLPAKYDHESTIRQSAKFALALGAMFADQTGPQGKQGHFTHNDEIRSFHDSQFVLHGPVWYTDDVLGFLKSHESDPLYRMYSLFVKHSEFRDQREYRFVLQCETPVENDILHLHISGAMRDALAPPRTASPVTFKRLDDSDADSSSQKVVGPTSLNKTMTRTRRKSEGQRRTLSVGGKVVEEEIMDREQVIVLTTEVPADSLPEAADNAKSAIPGIGKFTETENQERRIAGAGVDTITKSRTWALSIEDTSEANELFTLEDRDHAAELLKAVEQPFEAFSTLPKQATEALKTLAKQASALEPDVEVQTMSACWNGIWAICNLYECFGDVVASVGIEQDEFVAITLKESAHSGAQGKILVGPRGTFAYVLTLGDKHRPGEGGIESRLFFFPDNKTHAAFEEFGWSPLADGSAEVAPS